MLPTNKLKWQFIDLCAILGLKNMLAYEANRLLGLLVSL